MCCLLDNPVRRSLDPLLLPPRGRYSLLNLECAYVLDFCSLFFPKVSFAGDTRLLFYVFTLSEILLQRIHSSLPQVQLNSLWSYRSILLSSRWPSVFTPLQQACLHLAVRRTPINALAVGEAVVSAEASSTTFELFLMPVIFPHSPWKWAETELSTHRVLSYAPDRYYVFRPDEIREY